MRQKIILRILSFFFIVLVQEQIVFGKTQDCRLNYFAFDIDHLKCLKNSAVVRSIKSNFLKFESMSRRCPKCREAFPESSRYAPLYTKSYLAISLERHEFGGYFVSILFRNDPLVYRLWMYQLEGEEFQVRSLETRQLALKATRQLLEYVEDPKYSPYWSN